MNEAVEYDPIELRGGAILIVKRSVGSKITLWLKLQVLRKLIRGVQAVLGDIRIDLLKALAGVEKTLISGSCLRQPRMLVEAAVLTYCYSSGLRSIV